ncbi:MAG: S66 peptidase family protein [Halanaeroarchaeum sp.]
MPDFVTPPPLEPGSSVAIVAPASGLADAFPHVYEHGLERMRSVFDLDPVEYPTATMSTEYLADHPEERARDIERAFADPGIDGVVATIGGNDQIRVLEHLDPSVLREHPTRFFGQSDNTNLALYLWTHGVVSYYGGHVMTEFGVPGTMPEYLERSLRSVLFEESIGELRPAPRFTDQDLSWADPENLSRTPEMEATDGWHWAGGDDPVEGRTWGGSLEITTLHLAADRYLPDLDDLDGAVLVLETSEELPSADMVKRSLMGMGERGLLERVGAVLVGRPKARSHDVNRTAAERADYRERQRDAIESVVATYDPSTPLVFGVDFGHTNPVVPIPIGARVRIDPTEERIVFA